jgi:DNA-binding CsgD family transcriptional regulator
MNPDPQKLYLTPRELQVLKLISQGYSSKYISKELFISETTVTTHRKHLREKLMAKNSPDLISKAYKKDLI